MNRLATLITVIMVALLAAAPASAQVRVVEAVLCGDIIDRQPVDIVTSRDSASLSTVEAGKASQIYLWTKISASEEVTIVHSWYREDSDAARTGMELAPEAEIELRIAPSGGFRTWSSMGIFPGVSEGQWRVTVTTAADSQTILYQEAFLVK